MSTDFKQTLWKAADELGAQMDAIDTVLRQAELVAEHQVAA